jgi:hypothetical protein
MLASTQLVFFLPFWKPVPRTNEKRHDNLSYTFLFNCLNSCFGMVNGANEQARVDELLDWCKNEDIWIHPALEIKSTSFEMVRYVVYWLDGV